MRLGGGGPDCIRRHGVLRTPSYSSGTCVRFVIHPPVILVSGSPLEEVEKQALAHGAFAFIRKPLDLRELDRVLVLALENQKGSQLILPFG